MDHGTGLRVGCCIGYSGPTADNQGTYGSLTSPGSGIAPWGMTTFTWTRQAGRIDALAEISGSRDDYDGLIELIGTRRIVLIGEATHGTHEFYRERARITARLIEECGFEAIAVEADWPDAYRVHRFLQGRSEDRTAGDALGDFRRFPSWMWRNADVVAFLHWLRQRNDAYPDVRDKVGFFGLDLYGMRAAMEAVVAYLDGVDAKAAEVARHRYACFDAFPDDGSGYGNAVRHDPLAGCEEQVVAQLIELHQRKAQLLAQDGWLAEEDFFFAEQNARLVLSAERYYRHMYHGQVSSWNLRDRHMANTLESLLVHLNREQGHAKVIVWAHNSHVGDARATELGRRGELTLGQVVRQRHPRDAFSIGFTTHHGRVTAASEWSGPAERMRLRPALEHSYEHFLHEVGRPAFWIPADRNRLSLPTNLLQRAIGVVYRPETERTSHWFHADIAREFDAIIHVDETSALTPLERTPAWDQGEPEATFPSGL